MQLTYAHQQLKLSEFKKAAVTNSWRFLHVLTHNKVSLLLKLKTLFEYKIYIFQLKKSFWRCS